jgi:NAD kinase
MSQLGIKTTIKKEVDIHESDFHDRDLFITIGMNTKLYYLLGGDSTYLRTAGYIESSGVPILGIDSDPSRNSEALCNISIPFETRGDSIKKILLDLVA